MSRHDVTDVIDENVVLVPCLEFFKEPVRLKISCSLLHTNSTFLSQHSPDTTHSVIN